MGKRSDACGLPESIGAGMLTGRRVLLCVTGSVAAYKAVILARRLVQAQAEVTVILTRAAVGFVQAQTFSAVTGRPVHTEMSSPEGELHVRLAEWAHCVVVAPATADCLARAAQGRACDLLSALLLCVRCPIVCAPAMHPTMFSHPLVAANLAVLRGLERWHFVGPESGPVASGDRGLGRMTEPEQVADEVLQLLRVRPRALAGRHVVVTAGPTSEAIDPVRSLTNHSSGRMGFALAAAARQRGARVTLIAGPVHRQSPFGVHRVNVVSALEMQSEVLRALGPGQANADALLMCAAVADYRPAHPSTSKRKRSVKSESLALVANPDILAEIGRSRQGARPYLLGFALETAGMDELIERAEGKRLHKRVDAIVANRAQDALGTEATVAVVVSATGQRSVRGAKADAAEQIIDFVSEQLGVSESSQPTECRIASDS